jgi:hypothetical protein
MSFMSPSRAATQTLAAPAASPVPSPPSVTDKDVQAAGDAARASAAAAAGRVSTILTSGMGASDYLGSRKKTLLGA